MPETKATVTSCPHCGESKFLFTRVRERKDTDGRVLETLWAHTCKKCGTAWQGEPGSVPVQVVVPDSRSRRES
jgi:predicted  nucleic acid-binding Zn-ribbon protein